MFNPFTLDAIKSAIGRTAAKAYLYSFVDKIDLVWSDVERVQVTSRGERYTIELEREFFVNHITNVNAAADVILVALVNHVCSPIEESIGEDVETRQIKAMFRDCLARRRAEFLHQLPTTAQFYRVGLDDVIAVPRIVVKPQAEMENRPLNVFEEAKRLAEESPLFIGTQARPEPEVSKLQFIYLELHPPALSQEGSESGQSPVNSLVEEFLKLMLDGPKARGFAGPPADVESK